MEFYWPYTLRLFIPFTAIALRGATRVYDPHGRLVTQLRMDLNTSAIYL